MRIVKKYLSPEPEEKGGSGLDAWPDTIEGFEDPKNPDDEKKPDAPDPDKPDPLEDKDPTDLDDDDDPDKKKEPKEEKGPEDKEPDGDTTKEGDELLLDDDDSVELEEISWTGLAKELELEDVVDDDMDKFKEGFKKRLDKAKAEGIQEAQSKQIEVSLEKELSKLPVEAQAQFKLAATGETFKEEKAQINNLKGWIEVDDETLIRAIYKEKKWDEDRIDKKIATLAQSDSLKDEADDFRIQLEAQITEKEKQIQEKMDQSWNNLVTTLKNKESEFSGEIKNHIGKLTKVFDIPLKENNIQRLNEGLESFRKRITTDPDFVAKVYATHVYGEKAVKLITSENYKAGRKESINEFRNSKTPRDNQGAGRSRAAARSQQSKTGIADGSHFDDWDNLSDGQ